MVEPRGKLRFAMTSRYVRPETMPSAESRAECVKKGTIPNGLEKLAYKGIDIDSISGDANLTNADTNVACVKSKKRLIVTIPISETGRAAIGNMERTAGTVQTKSQVELKPFGVITPFSFNGINDIGDFGDSTIVPPPITL